jgi:hypothetical protein
LKKKIFEIDENAFVLGRIRRRAMGNALTGWGQSKNPGLSTGFRVPDRDSGFPDSPDQYGFSGTHALGGQFIIGIGRGPASDVDVYRWQCFYTLDKNFAGVGKFGFFFKFEIG